MVHDTPAVRLQLRELFRGAQWLCRFTVRENGYQQALELWSAGICSRAGGPAERALSSSLARCSGMSRTAN